MSAQDPRVRNMKIKTGVVKRLTKEKLMYEKEAVQQQERIDKLKADNGDEYVVKKQIEVLNETLQMIPDSLRRLKQAIAELDSLMSESQTDLSELEEFTTAKQQLDDAQKVVDAHAEAS